MDKYHSVKNPLKSKTLWASLILAVMAFWPPGQAFFAANPQMVGLVIAGATAVLRLATKNKLTFKKDT